VVLKSAGAQISVFYTGWRTTVPRSALFRNFKP